MGRKAHLCGYVGTNFKDLFYAAMSGREERPSCLGGRNATGATGFRYHADRVENLQLYVVAAWAPNTWWLDLRHYDYSWDAYPCIVHGDTLRRVLMQWFDLDEFRWSRLAAAGEAFPNRNGAQRAKKGRSRNGVTFTRGKCLALFHSPDGYILDVADYPHTFAPAHNWSLLSARPIGTREEFAAAGRSLSKVDGHLPFGVALPWSEVQALAPVFTDFMDGHLSSIPSPVVRMRSARLQAGTRTPEMRLVGPRELKDVLAREPELAHMRSVLDTRPTLEDIERAEGIVPEPPDIPVEPPDDDEPTPEEEEGL